MPWNEPSRSPGGPPDLDKLLRQLFHRLKGRRTPASAGVSADPPSRGWIWALIPALLALFVVLWFLSGFFIVNPAEQGVVLRFGQFDRTVPPGLHWIPRFIESGRTIDIQKIYSFPLEGNFLTKSSSQDDAQGGNKKDVLCTGSSAAASGACADQSKNLVDVELNVMYRISNPRQYLYGTVNPDDTMQQLAASALSEVTGAMQLDEVLTTGRESLASGVFDRLKAALARYPAGLAVVAVNLRKVQAPDQVREAFNDVNRAMQDRKTAINQAETYASRVIPQANGVAARILAAAQGYQQRIVLIAKGDIARYQSLLPVYLASPEVTRTRLYFDTLQTVFAKSTKVLVDIDRNASMIYLPIDRLVAAQRQSAPPTETDK